MATTSSDIYINGTAHDPTVQLQARLDARSDELVADLTAKTALVTELALSPPERDWVCDGLLSWCTDHLGPALAAADQALYAVAAGAEQTRLLVRALRGLQQRIHRHVEDLNQAGGVEQFTTAAHALAAVVAAYLHVHTTVFVPALVVLPGVDALDPIGDFDTVLAGGVLDAPSVLDVREIPHGRRHPRIFACYARLGPGESFVLVNNNDPKRLHREFEATYLGEFRWDYVENGPQQWQVRITRVNPGGVMAPADFQGREPNRVPSPTLGAIEVVCPHNAEASPGVLWRLQDWGRQVDANIVHLSPGGRVDWHTERQRYRHCAYRRRTSGPDRWQWHSALATAQHPPQSRCRPQGADVCDNPPASRRSADPIRTGHTPG